MKRTKNSNAKWASAPKSFPDGDTNDLPPPPKIKLRHQSFNVAASGSLTSRVSYVHANSSPKKPSPMVGFAEINWNLDPPPKEPSVEEFPWMDPAYIHHIEDSTGLPPKRKRTAGVCDFLVSQDVF